MSNLKGRVVVQKDELKESESASSLSKESFLKRSQTAGSRSAIEDQVDFRQPAWANMLVDLNLPPFARAEKSSELLSYHLKWVHTVGYWEKVPVLVVLIKMIRMVGDCARAVMKDPTGEYDWNTVHKSVFESYPDLTQGCVVQLRDVSVVSPEKNVHYLVVLPENVVRVWPKTVKIASKQLACLSRSLYQYSSIYEDGAQVRQSAASQPASLNSREVKARQSQRREQEEKKIGSCCSADSAKMDGDARFVYASDVDSVGTTSNRDQTSCANRTDTEAKDNADGGARTARTDAANQSTADVKSSCAANDDGAMSCQGDMKNSGHVEHGASHDGRINWNPQISEGGPGREKGGWRGLKVNRSLTGGKIAADRNKHNTIEPNGRARKSARLDGVESTVRGAGGYGETQGARTALITPNNNCHDLNEGGIKNEIVHGNSNMTHLVGDKKDLNDYADILECAIGEECITTNRKKNKNNTVQANTQGSQHIENDSPHLGQTHPSPLPLNPTTLNDLLASITSAPLGTSSEKAEKAEFQKNAIDNAKKTETGPAFSRTAYASSESFGATAEQHQEQVRSSRWIVKKNPSHSRELPKKIEFAPNNANNSPPSLFQSGMSHSTNALNGTISNFRRRSPGNS
ncbi:uncharacterized protein LOC126318645 [Schistocerca gregaria]|uniref:uncharacterized protein LOC126318645 n=1 Tax=Schistocerca gregaria TaxID=7010 RepID=UPI00211F18B5|nr:uncharacterized protein LOC126318645 [Schistocerca gregaria]